MNMELQQTTATDLITQKQVTFPRESFNNQNKTLYFKYSYRGLIWKTYLLGFFLLVIIVNFFCNISLLIANIYPQNLIEEYYYLPFHELDFWGAFVFALCEGCVLVMTEMVSFENFRIYLIITNIGGTLTALILFNFNPEYFETISHWIEYSTQLLLTLTDFLFIFQSQQKNSTMYKYRYLESFIIILAFILSILKLLVYGDVIPNDDNERLAHFLEYNGEMINDCFVFFFIYLQLKQENQSANQIFQAQFEKLLVHDQIEDMKKG